MRNNNSIQCLPTTGGCTKRFMRCLVIWQMSAATAKQLSRKLNSIAESWVKDPFRSHLQLQTFLKSLAAHPRLTPQAVDAACALRDNQLQKKVHSHSRQSYSQLLTCCIISIPCPKNYCSLPLLRFIMNDSLKALKRARRVLADLGGRYFLVSGNHQRKGKAAMKTNLLVPLCFSKPLHQDSYRYFCYSSFGKLENRM